MKQLKLYMILLGCTPPERNTEQHDVFFCIGETLESLVPDMIEFWPEANKKIHIDAWREVNQVGNFQITISEKRGGDDPSAGNRLFFINLGGYKQNEFEEFHYKMLVAGTAKQEAIAFAKQTAFYLHTGFKGASSHIDDKFGVDVDDVFEIKDILPKKFKDNYSIHLNINEGGEEDEIHLGYLKIEKLQARLHSGK